MNEDSWYVLFIEILVKACMPHFATKICCYKVLPIPQN